MRNTPMRSGCLALAFAVILALSPLHTALAADSPGSFSATVTDISDRAYRPAVMQLLDNAKHSIVISMYAVSLGPEGNNPMKFMIDRLFAARERGVLVTLYLNTCFRSSERSPRNLVENPVLDKLKAAGCTVILLPTNRKVHDKLIIVDSAYIVEGSTNWSLSALMSNYESDTLTHSPDLAAVKLLRLANLPTADSHDNPPPKRVPSTLYLEGLPAELVIPAAFVEDRKYLSSMIRHLDNRSISFYMLLLAHSQKTGQKDFYVDLESMGLSLGVSEDAGNVGLRRQVIKTLKRLDAHYGLVKATFFHDKDAAVKLVNIPDKTFTVTTQDLGLSPGQPLSARIRWLVLAKAYLAANGENIDSMSDYALTKRFGVTHCTIGDARRDRSGHFSEMSDHPTSLTSDIGK